MALIDRVLAPNSALQRRLFFLAGPFVAGETIESALRAVRALNDAGMSATLDFLGEDVLEHAAAEHVRDVYVEILEAIRASGVNANVSVKLTAVGLRIDPDLAFANLTRLLDCASLNGDPFVRIDMEGSAVTQATLDVFERAFATRRNVGPVLQAMLLRTPSDVERAIAIGARVRLCKGAYKEGPRVAIQKMPRIRSVYLYLAKRLLTRGVYPGIATHDLRLIDAVTRFAREAGVGPDRFEFQMLYGCRPGVQRRLVAQGWRVRVYVPFGTHWAGYLYRRMLERRENLLFALSSLFRK